MTNLEILNYCVILPVGLTFILLILFSIFKDRL